MDKYAQLCWNNLDWIVKATDLSEQNFEAGWSKTVSDYLEIPAD